MLLIEVSSAALAYDRRVKLPLYARHGVPDFWIVDLDALAIDVDRVPSGDGHEACSSEGQGRMLEVSCLPGVHVSVSDLR